MKSVKNNFEDKKVNELLTRHFKELTSVSPICRGHVLDVHGLKDLSINFWSFWKNEELIGCGAIKIINLNHGEFKSIRVSDFYRGKGYGIKVIQNLIEEAKKLKIRKISLETGTDIFFNPARKLFKQVGFKECQPFANYKYDANACFMNLFI